MEEFGGSDKSFPISARTKLDPTRPCLRLALQGSHVACHTAACPNSIAHVFDRHWPTHSYHTAPRPGPGTPALYFVAQRRWYLHTSSHLVHTERCTAAACAMSTVAHFQGLFRSTLGFTELVHERAHRLDLCRNTGGCQGALRIIVHDWQNNKHA